MTPTLHVVTYHYVRDTQSTAFPAIKALRLADFQFQLRLFQQCYEMATLESALDYLQGRYTPPKDLCLMTFDDGLREHFTAVMPMLADASIQGLFFPITSCLGQDCVAAVHMSHFLMAYLGFERYSVGFREAASQIAGNNNGLGTPDARIAQRTYPLDQPEVAEFKYLFNFLTPAPVRDRAVRDLFRNYIGDEGEFARGLYFGWTEARQMQTAGMVLGGHTHEHRPLATLCEAELHRDLSTSTKLLESHMHRQPFWPFSYPYGKRDSFTPEAVSELRSLGYDCAFSTEIGANAPGMDLFVIHRVDTNKMPRHGSRVS
jgi:peptidoglycan/xylan/chitin deacetylase (PgdA/CDA1 family)